jgi:hypothetical protein
MTDIYLKAPTIQDFYNELGEPFVKEVEYDNDGVLATKKIFTTEVTHACSYVGVIVDEAGIYDEEDNELQAPTFVDGVHLNIRILNDLELPEFTNVEQVTPNSPSRVWA